MSEIRGNDAFLKTLRVALVHDWLTGMRGGEKCLEVFCEIFPQADLYTLFHFPGTVSPTIERHPIHTTWVQHLPFLAAKYRNYLPLFPLAMEGLSFKGYDLVLSSSHCVAKAARALVPGETHLLCFHPHPLCLGHVRHLLRSGIECRAPTQAADALGRPSFPKMGCPDLPAGGSLFGRFRSCAKTDPALLPAGSGSDSGPGRHRAIQPGRTAPGLLPDGHGPGPLQAGRPGGTGLQSIGNPADHRGPRPAARTSASGIQKKYHLVRLGRFRTA